MGGFVLASLVSVDDLLECSLDIEKEIRGGSPPHHFKGFKDVRRRGGVSCSLAGGFSLGWGGVGC